MPDQRPLPPFDDLLALIQASLRNAAALLGDARMLLAGGSAPRAHALATLALEEIGKSCLCMLALVPVPESMVIFGAKSKGDFWAAWREHTDKLEWALGFLGLLLRDSGPAAQAVARIRTAAHSGHLRKLRGFYVDYDDHTVLEPTDVTQAEAQQIIADTETLLNVVSAAWLTDGTLERTRENLGQHGGDLAAFIERAGEAVQADMDAALIQVRQVIASALEADAPPDSPRHRA
jgi:AbiV family abortive infection protein